MKPDAYPARPPGMFPSLVSIKHLPREERAVPLEAWVTWVNANKGRMNPQLEHLLDETLSELEAREVPPSDFEELGRRFDEWLDSLDQVPRPEEPEHLCAGAQGVAVRPAPKG